MKLGLLQTSLMALGTAFCVSLPSGGFAGAIWNSFYVFDSIADVSNSMTIRTRALEATHNGDSSEYANAQWQLWKKRLEVFNASVEKKTTEGTRLRGSQDIKLILDEVGNNDEVVRLLHLQQAIKRKIIKEKEDSDFAKAIAASQASMGLTSVSPSQNLNSELTDEQALAAVIAASLESAERWTPSIGQFSSRIKL